jgi:hypothetical protein
LAGFFHVVHWRYEVLSYLQQRRNDADVTFRSPAIPGQSLLHALWQRNLMRLSDRGRASELIGHRWAALCAEALAMQAGKVRPIPGMGDDSAVFTIAGIARLDDIPQVAATASREKLQNPDFLLIGERDGHQVLQSADAKFSVETAKSKQVSADVVTNLLLLGSVITDHLPELEADAEVVDGFFICPDFSLTHYMLQSKGSPRGGVSVTREQIELLPVSADSFMTSLAGTELALQLARIDAFALSPHESLLLFLYYFRLARACVGCWVDQHAPLLAYKDVTGIDMPAILEFATWLGGRSNTAWDVILQWDAAAEQVRQQRLAVDRAAMLPVSSGELRSHIEAQAKKQGVVAPSMGRIRRVVGAWFRVRLRERFGAIHPPVEDFPHLLHDTSRTAQELRPAMFSEVDRAIAQAVMEDADGPRTPAASGVRETTTT